MASILRSIATGLNRTLDTLFRKPIKSRIMNKVVQQEIDTLVAWGLLNQYSFGFAEENPALQLIKHDCFPYHTSQMYMDTVRPSFPSFLQQVDNIHFHIDNQLSSFFTLLQTEGYNPDNLDKNEIYLPQVKGSMIPKAGFGLFSTGPIPAGQVVSIYPGVIYFPPDHSQIPGFPSETGDHLASRYDNIIIDASRFADPSSTEFQKIISKNPLSHGHFINHPPAGQAPTILPVNYDFTDIYWDSKLDSFVPLSEFEGSALSSMAKLTLGTNPSKNILRGVVYIALKDIEQSQELFVDYRYNPRIDLPDWYTPFDKHAAFLRWDN